MQAIHTQQQWQKLAHLAHTSPQNFWGYSKHAKILPLGNYKWKTSVKDTPEILLRKQSYNKGSNNHKNKSVIKLIWRQRSTVKHFCIFQSKKCRATCWYTLTGGSKQNTRKWDWSPCRIISKLPTASMAVSCSQHTVRGGKITRRGHHSFWCYGWSQIQVLLEAWCLSQGQVSGQNISLTSKRNTS